MTPAPVPDPSSTENDGSTPAAIAAGVFGAWRRILTEALRAASGLALRISSALRSGWQRAATPLLSGTRRVAHASRRAVVDATDAASTLPAAIFAAWHRLIGAVARALAHSGNAITSSVRAWVAQWPRVRAYHTNPALSFAEGDATGRTAAAVGIRAFIFGVVVAGAIASAAAGLPAPGIVTVVSEILWAAARFVIIALLMPRGAIDRTRLSVAFLAGLLPYAVGATVLLRLASLALSAALTRRGILGVGVPPRETNLAIGWSFGGQAGVIALTWIVRAAVALLASV